MPCAFRGWLLVSCDGRCPKVARAGGKFQISSNFNERFGGTKAVRLDSHVRRKLIWHSIFGGIFITLLAIALRFAGINRPVPSFSLLGV